MKTLLSIILIISFSTIIIAQSPRTQSRSAKTGRYVSNDYANKHPSTTYTTKKKK